MTKPKKTKRTQRLRKKLYVDEFQVFGFHIMFNLKTSDETILDNTVSELIELIELRNLIIGGGGTPEHFEGYITSNDRYLSTTDEDRESMSKWLNDNPNIQKSKVGDVTDACYGI